MLQQQTLKGTASFSGIGLHSGNRVNMTFLPAPPKTGIRFRRVDLEGKPEIEARIDNVSETARSTTLSKGNAKVHTVEHVLAAFAGCGVDNAVVELDANEPPIADGSAREYVRMIKEAGIAPQTEPRETYKLTEAIEMNLGGTLMTAFPHDTFKITCTSADKDGQFTQCYSLEVTPESWEKELSLARTFCFFEEIEYLFKNGLIKGGSLENAIIIRDDAVLTNEPLRYADEFVRHKMLDILGDLSLLGRPVMAHIIAVKPSHSANAELSKKIQAQMLKPLQQAQTFTPPPAPVKPAEGKPAKVAKPAPCMDVIDIMKVLPHRYPFLMVDRVLEIEGNKIKALKNLSMNELFFQGHYPGHPVMPGVLQLEAMAQVAGLLMSKQADSAGKVAYFMSADSVKWRKPVHPGDTLIIEVEMTKTRGRIGKGKGTCSVDGDVVSEAEVTFMLVGS
jgi:UDP-3-O-[3-hydroxymyristoyl] N-acetylglucosamine deacetylase/3-hydroxyacyl-[acyl-carrier-protein] dehydratase